MTERQSSAAGKRVLVAEDDYFIAKGLARHLRAAGAEVVGPVPMVSDALDLLAVEQLDGAVLDINLRGDLVFPVADALMNQGVPFVFATGYSAGAGAVPERFASIVRCEKPIKPDWMIRALFPGLQ